MIATADAVSFCAKALEATAEAMLVDTAAAAAASLGEAPSMRLAPS